MEAHAVLADPIRRARYDDHLLSSQIGQSTDRRDKRKPEKTFTLGYPGTDLPAVPHERPSIIVGPLRWEPPRQGGILK